MGNPPDRKDMKESNSEGSGMPNWLVYLFSIIGLIYLLNPTSGLIELVPDNIPIVGNLDEGAAAVLLWQGIQLLLKKRSK